MDNRTPYRLFILALASLTIPACVGYIGISKTLPSLKDPIPAIEVCEPFRPPTDPIIPTLPDIDTYREHSDAEIAEELALRLVEMDAAFHQYVKQQQKAYTDYLERCQGKRVKVYPAAP